MRSSSSAFIGAQSLRGRGQGHSRNRAALPTPAGAQTPALPPPASDDDSNSRSSGDTDGGVGDSVAVAVFDDLSSDGELVERDSAAPRTSKFSLFASPASPAPARQDWWPAARSDMRRSRVGGLLTDISLPTVDVGLPHDEDNDDDDQQAVPSSTDDDNNDDVPKMKNSTSKMKNSKKKKKKKKIAKDNDDKASADSTLPELNSTGTFSPAGWRNTQRARTRRGLNQLGYPMLHLTAEGKHEWITRPLLFLWEEYNRNCSEIPALDGALPRDLHIRDINRLIARESVLLVRHLAVVIHLDRLAALVLPTQCFVLFEEGADEEISIVQRWFCHFYKISQESRHDFAEQHWDAGVPFELLALETIFHSVVGVGYTQDEEGAPPHHYSLLRRTLKMHEENARNLATTNSLERLHMLTVDIARFKRRIANVKGALKGLLERDHDMALMNLSKVCTSPAVYTDANEAAWIWDHEEIEVILVATLQDLDEVSKARKVMDDCIDIARKDITLRIETMRNRLLRIDLYFSAITAMCAIGALVAGIFGMNLNSQIMDTVGIFWPVAALSFFVPLGLAAGFLITAEFRRWLV